MLISTLQLGALLLQIAIGQSARIQESCQSSRPEISVAGVVLNGATGLPMERASVAVIDLQERVLHHALTGPDGRFSFPKVRPLTRLRVWRRGYRDESQRNVWEKFLSSATSAEFKVKLFELGAVTGTVTGENGEPLLGITVQALSSKVSNGRRQVSQYAYNQTNDLGQYRLWHLSPGQYYVKALGRRSVSLGVGAMPLTREGELAYGPQYFPSGATKEEAALLNLQPGETLQVDFRLSGRPAFSIRGRLLQHTLHDDVQGEVRQGTETMGSRVKVELATGRFEAADVPAGSYILSARTRGTPVRRGETQVTVGSADVNGVTLNLSAGVTVKGAIRAAGGGRVDMASVELSGASLDSPPERYSANTGSVDSSNEFQIPNVLPGRYKVQLPNRLDVAEIRSGSIDVLREGLTITETGCAPLELTLARERGSLEVEVAGGAQARTAWVTVVRIVGELVYSQSQPMPPEGLLSLTELAPGEYRVFAWRFESPVEYENPAVLESLAGRIATIVVRNGETAKATVALPSEANEGAAR
ncbi:MAG: carboxypeptidase regulatory-like domain-containing protein [Candidatus Solibacter usitatus]|nr:carboxypeptidase regulatory-like domain-containing protein [Candidatus Solibacter usitatus]